jgi:chromate transporter
LAASNEEQYSYGNIPSTTKVAFSLSPITTQLRPRPSKQIEALLRIEGEDCSFWIRVSGFLTQTAFVTVGGSYTVIPYVAQVTVTKFSWLSHAEMLNGFALDRDDARTVDYWCRISWHYGGISSFHGSIVMWAVSLLVTTF